jgi:hypothetical protein
MGVQPIDDWHRLIVARIATLPIDALVDRSFIDKMSRDGEGSES